MPPGLCKFLSFLWQRPQCGAGQQGRSAQQMGPPWTRARELQTLSFEQCAVEDGSGIVMSGVDVEEA